MVLSNAAQDPNELFDVVDENDCVIGQATRAEVHRKKWFHRAVHILIFAANGNIILQKRSLEKDTCPGLFSTSCAGHVDSGETYENAARRELGEELGVPLHATKALRFLFAMSPQKALGWEFIRVYALNYTGAFTPNPAEVESLLALAPADLDEQIKTAPEKFAESFCLVWENFRKNGQVR